MKQVYTYTDVSTDCLNELTISAGANKVGFQVKADGQYRVRVIVEFAAGQSLFSPDLFGAKQQEQKPGKLTVIPGSAIYLHNKSGLFVKEIPIVIGNEEYQVACTVYKDRPMNPNGIFDIMTIPADILTLHILLATKELVDTDPKDKVQHFFDGYNYLGFFLADLSGMKEIIEKEYGNSELDLSYVLANSDLVDKLFDAGILVITWGINPYAYPLYSCESNSLVELILGTAFDFEGEYRIREDIKQLSLVQGHKLKQWPHFLNEQWPMVDLYGEGEKVILKPFALKDSDGMAVIPSFALYRSQDKFTVPKPLINVNLLN